MYSIEFGQGGKVPPHAETTSHTMLSQWNAKDVQ
jgi:hypothetical protein